jgi:hypothetical protein
VEHGAKPRGHIEVVRLLPKVNVRDARERSEGFCAESFQRLWRKEKHPSDQRKCQREQQRGSKSARASKIETAEGKRARFIDLAAYESRDEKSTDDEEDIDANESAGKARDAEMKEEHDQHCDCAESIDVGLVFRVRHS